MLFLNGKLRQKFRRTEVEPSAISMLHSVDEIRNLCKAVGFTRLPYNMQNSVAGLRSKPPAGFMVPRTWW